MEKPDYKLGDVSRIIRIVTAAAKWTVSCYVAAVPLKMAIAQNTTTPNKHLLDVYLNIKDKLLASPDKQIKVRTVILDSRLNDITAEWRMSNAEVD